MRILIGTPSGDTCHARFVQCRDMAVGYLMSRGVEVATDIQIGNNVPLNHNALCDKAMQIGADYLFHVETDVLFPADAPLRLAALGKDIAGAAIAYKDQRKCWASGYELDGKTSITVGSKQEPREVLNLRFELTPPSLSRRA